jgi:SprT protein
MMKGLAKPLDFFKTPWFRPAATELSPRSASLEDDTELIAWSAMALKSLGMLDLARHVKVSWNPRMRTTAGRAWWPQRLVELNPKLKSCEPEELWRTLKHELAHLVAYERAGRRRIEPHGAEWKMACADLGIPGESTCHSLPFKRRQMKRKHVYICKHCQEIVRRVRPLKRAVACYSCCKLHNAGKYHDRFRLVKHMEESPNCLI